MRKNNRFKHKTITAIFSAFLALVLAALAPSIVMAQELAEAGVTASGTDWSLGDDGTLIIVSDAGMTSAVNALNGDASLKARVTSAELSNITSIPAYAFRGYSELVSITIPETVTEIGMRAFEDCSKLASVDIPGGVTRINEYTFSACIGLISVSIPEGVTQIGRNAFYNCWNLSELTIPQSVQVIGQYAFNNCKSLPEIRIPTGVSDSSYGEPCIAEGAFMGCNSLTQVTVPEGVVTLGQFAFSDCKNLTSVDIPDSVTTIGNYAFSSCPKLTNVTIPQNVTSIGHQVFDGNSALTSVIMKGETPPRLGYNVFQSCPLSSGGIYVPTGTGTDYKSSSTWADWEQYIVDSGNFVTEAIPIVEAALANITATNETEPEMILTAVNNALSTAGISTVHTAISNFEKTPASVGKKGRVACTITISFGSESNSLAFDKPIAALEEEDNNPEEGPAKIDGEVTTDGTAPSVQFAAPIEELADILLSDAEKQMLAEGKTIKIVLDVKSMPTDVSQEDKTLIEAALDGSSIGLYLDISLAKVVDGVNSVVSETKEKLLITISIPDSLKNNDSNGIRNFFVIRVHNGEIEILEDLDNSEDSITIATDRFSTYALVYKDVTSNDSDNGNNSDNGNIGDGGNNNTDGSSSRNDTESNQTKATTDRSGYTPPKTGDDTPLQLYVFLIILTSSLTGLACLRLIIKRLKLL